MRGLIRTFCFSWIGKSLVVLLLAWVVLWMAAQWAAPKVLAMVLPRIEAKAKSLGVEIDQIEYRKIRVSPWLNAVTAEQVAVDFDLAPGDVNRLSSAFRSESVEIRIRDLFRMRGSVSMDGFSVHFHQSDRPPGFPFEGLSDGDVRVDQLPLLAPREALQGMMDGLLDLFDDNRTMEAFGFSGVVQLVVADGTVPARLYSERHGGGYRLRFSAEDVRQAARVMGMHLADEQIEIISLYPLRVPLIVVLTDRSRHISQQHFHGDMWKQDALRHVLWSYLLTRSFGAPFAKEVTDAQEAKPGNTHYERLMDYNNNAVGRVWVEERIVPEQIPTLLLRDPRVVLSPDDAKRRGEADLMQ